jgi:hypothetical protein
MTTISAKIPASASTRFSMVQTIPFNDDTVI